MSIVDKAKRFREKVLDRTLAQRVVFHHVPKCGGTSVGRAFRKKYFLSQATVTPESSYRAFEAFTGRQDREQMLIDVLDIREQMFLYLLFEDIRCVSLHVGFSNAAFRAFSPKYRFVTVLRHPVERFISHFFWSYGKTSAHAGIEEPIDRFLETQRARRLGATYVEYFSGLPSSADIFTPRAVELAVDNLRRLDAVGRLDDLASFKEQVREQLGVALRIGHENKARKKSGSDKMTLAPGLRHRIEELCAPDLAVWNGFFDA